MVVVTILERDKNIDYIVTMKGRFLKSQRPGNAHIPFVMLVLLLSSILLTTFHRHQCHETVDNCAICNFHSSYSAVKVEPETNHTLFFKPLSERAITLNEKVTDPSQKLVCTTHAPPQFS